MSRDSAEVEEAGAEELEKAMRAAGLPGARGARGARAAARALPLDYAQKRASDAPFDWPSSIRQFVFALGVGFIAGAATDVWGNNPWKDNEVMWIGFGAFFIAMTLSPYQRQLLTERRTGVVLCAMQMVAHCPIGQVANAP